MSASDYIASVRDELALTLDENGKYPVTATGKTYGSELLYDVVGEKPDLIYAEGIDGTLGYILSSDLEPNVNNPEEAVAYTERQKSNQDGYYTIPLSVFDKGIITQHLKNGANLHQTAAIGETQSGGFFCDMAGAYWRPPCFGYQGGPQQTPAILPAKSKLSCGDFETKCPKAIVVPAYFCIGALVVYPHSRKNTLAMIEYKSKRIGNTVSYHGFNPKNF